MPIALLVSNLIFTVDEPIGVGLVTLQTCMLPEAAVGTMLRVPSHHSTCMEPVSAETGSMQVEWCDGTRSIVPTAASGSIHVWSVTSPTPMGSSTVKIRLDTSNAIGKVSQITAQYPDSFSGSCD